ncbi:MAG: zf-HC2 domain-containing protein [Bacillota bacterium]
MNCEKSKDYMMKYFDGELSHIEEAQLRQHLKVCPDCGGEFRCMESILTVLEEKVEIEPPKDFEAKVMEQVASIEKERNERSARRIVWLYNASALLSIVLLLIYVADLKQVSILSAFDRIAEYFGSFSGAAGAVFGVVRDLFSLVGNALLVVADVALSIVKSYYYVFLALLAIVFAIQRLLHFVGTYGWRKSE